MHVQELDIAFVRVKGLASPTRTEGKMWLERAEDSAHALFLLGTLYQDGLEMEKDEEMSLDCLLRAAEHGFPLALGHYGESLSSAGRLEEALVQYEKGARMEQYLRSDYGSCIALLHFCTAKTPLLLSDDTSVVEKDPFPLVLFWARRAAMHAWKRRCH